MSEEDRSLSEVSVSDFFARKDEERAYRLRGVMPADASSAQSPGTVIYTRAGMAYVPFHRGVPPFSISLLSFDRLDAEACEIVPGFVCVLVRESFFIVDPLSACRPSPDDMTEGHIQIAEHGSHWLVCAKDLRAEVASSTSIHRPDDKEMVVSFANWELCYYVGDEVRKLFSFTGSKPKSSSSH